MAKLTSLSIGILALAGVVGGCGGTVAIDDNVVDARDPEALWTYVDDTIGNDHVRSLAFDADGNVLATGTVWPASPGGGDVLLIKLDRDGEVIFRNVIGSADQGLDLGNDVAVLDNDVLNLTKLADQTTLRRYDQDGVQVWSKSWSTETAYRMQVTQAGDIVLSGPKRVDEQRDAPWLSVLDSNGAVLVDKTFDTGADALFSGPATDANGRVFVVHYDRDADVSSLRRYGSDGSLQLDKPNDCGGLVAADADGRLVSVVAGELVGTGVMLCMHTPDLERVWSIEVTRDGADFIGVQGLSFDGEGHVLVSGFSRSIDIPETYEMFVRKYDDEGNLLWDDAHRGPDDVFGYGFGVAADGDRHTVTGALLAGPSHDDYAAAIRMIRD